MATIKQIRSRVNPLLNQNELYEVAFEVLRRFEAYLVDFQILQLEQGQDRNQRIVGRYSRATELESLFGSGPKPRQEKKEGEPFNFEWTGGLFDGMILEIRGQTATFTSRDSKTPLLREKYQDIFGLQDRYLQEAIREKIAPAFARVIKNRIRGR